MIVFNTYIIFEFDISGWRNMDEFTAIQHHYSVLLRFAKITDTWVPRGQVYKIPVLKLEEIWRSGRR